VAEIESILSAETIQFLKKRHIQRGQNSKTRLGTNDKKNTKMLSNEEGTTESIIDDKNLRSDSIGSSRNGESMEEKEKMTKLLANLQSEEELDEIFAKLVDIDPSSQLPSNQEQDETGLAAATNLLRSTSARQRLLGAKQVCELLEQRINNLSSENALSSVFEDDEKYPTFLPVALRCLLDSPWSLKNTVLYSYVLRALYALTLLFSHPENRIYFYHDKSGSGAHNDPASIYQLCFMHDHVPVPPASHLYSKAQLSTKNDSSRNEEKLGISCYSTHASSESAKNDGEAFYADPLWTLLSKMLILPCISRMLLNYQKNNRRNMAVEAGSKFPMDGIVAICGILAMLSLRSPGAACAIAQHKDIMPSIITLTLQPLEEGDNVILSTKAENHKGLGSLFVVQTFLALPTIRLFCTLCRQSRTISMSGLIDSIMENVTIILASTAENEEEWELQKWCIVLWRTLLRYGSGISHLSTILPLSVSHLTSNTEQEYSLSSFYFTAYAAICDCVDTVASKDGHTSKTSLELKEDDRNILNISSVWLASHVKTSAEFLSQSVGITERGDVQSSTMRLASARIRLISSYTSASVSTTTSLMKSSQTNWTSVSIIPRSTCIQALNGVIMSNMLSHALEICFDCCVNDIDVEASVCSLLYSFFTALHSLLNEEENNTQDESDRVLDCLVTEIFTKVIQILSSEHATLSSSVKETSSSRRGWRNKAHFAVGRIMANILSTRSSSLGVDSVQKALPLVQSFIFCLIGNFDHGEEAMAAILLSQNIIFDIIEDCTTTFSSSRIVQEVLLREIMDTSSQSHVQLNHSFKLLVGHDISNSDGEPLNLESLRCGADLQLKPPTVSDNPEIISRNEVLSLPLGSDWLFKLLSGKIDLGEEPRQRSIRLQSTSNIVISTLKLILYLEKQNTQYTRNTKLGFKMYYLMNACLFPEEILRLDMFETLFRELFALYAKSSSNEEHQGAKAFMLACIRHTNKADSLTGARKNNKLIADEKILDEIFSMADAEEKKLNLSAKDLKAVDDFITDLCTAFADYGAQYDIFCTSIRFLLIPGFPTRKRILVLNSIKDLLHLLTTEEEFKDMSGVSMLHSLQRSMSGGLPMLDNSSRDSAELLDTIVLLVRNKKISSLKSGGFFYLYAVGYLSRNLASNAIRCNCGFERMKQRLNGVEQPLLDDIISVCFALIQQSARSANQLARIVIECVTEEEDSWQRLEKNTFSDEAWDKIVLDLKQLYESVIK